MTLLRTSLLLLAIVLLIIDGWPALAGTPEADDPYSSVEEQIDAYIASLCDDTEGRTR